MARRPAGSRGMGRRGADAVLRRLRLKIVALTLGVASAIMALAFSLVLGMTWNANYQEIHEALTKATEEGPSASASFSIGRASSTDILSDMHGDKGDARRFFPVAIYLVDDDGEVQASNESFVTMEESVRDASIAEALGNAEDEGVLRTCGVFYLKRSLASGTIVAFADAADFYAQMSRVGIRLGGVFVATLACLCVIAALFAHLVTRPVERAWAQQREFIANASHELKTPLTVIIANNDILASKPELTVAEQMRWVDGTRSEASRMRGLIEDMLTLARSDEVDPDERATMTQVDLSQTVAEAVLTFDAIAFEGGVEMVDEIGQGIRVRGNAAELERLVKILVDNAVKYAGMGGRVRVRLSEAHRGHPTLSVNNTGHVMGREELEHVFDRFWRSDAARTAQASGGYGLGLAIAKSIAEAHGARISVTSTSEDGTTFSVAF